MIGATEGFPDVMHLYNPWVPDLMASGLSFDRVPETLQRRLAQRAFPAALALTTYQGRLLGVPTENQIDALVYNKRMFADAGIAGPPATWQDLAEVAKRLTRRNAQGNVERVGFVMESWDWGMQFLTMLISEGGSYLDDAGNVAFTNEKGIQVLQRLVDWRSAGFFSTERWRFDQRTAAMGVMFPWARFGLVAAMKEDAAEEVGVGLMPAGAAGRAAYHYGWGFYVPTQSKNRDEAWRFIEFLSLWREQREITFLGQALAAIGSLPLLRDDIVSPVYRADQAFYEGFVRNFDFAVSEPKLPNAQRRMSILTAELNNALARRKHPTQALQDARVQIEALLKPAR